MIWSLMWKWKWEKIRGCAVHVLVGLRPATSSSVFRVPSRSAHHNYILVLPYWHIWCVRIYLASLSLKTSLVDTLHCPVVMMTSTSTSSSVMALLFRYLFAVLFGTLRKTTSLSACGMRVPSASPLARTAPTRLRRRPRCRSAHTCAPSARTCRRIA